MSSQDNQEIIGGGVLMVVGVFAALYAITSLRLGTLSHIGPGMFPAGLGILLAICGGTTALLGLRRTGNPIVIDFRSFFAVSAAILVFSFTIEILGLVPAIFSIVLISSRSDSKLSFLGMMMVAGFLSIITTLIFRVGLGMPIPIFAWNW